MVTNREIREVAKQKGVKLWEIADRFGINDGNFSRKLRHEFSAEKKNEVLNIISEIAASRTED